MRKRFYLTGWLGIMVGINLGCMDSSSQKNTDQNKQVNVNDTAESIVWEVAKIENYDMPIVPNYSEPVLQDTLSVITRYIGDDFPDSISLDQSAVANKNGVTKMVINTQDLDKKGLYKSIRGGGPHIWIAKRPGPNNTICPWSQGNELIFQMKASVPFVELRDPNGNISSGGFTAEQAPVTQLSFGFYLFDKKTQNQLAYIIPAYESRGTYQESANNSDTYVSFVSSPLEDKSLYITKSSESESLQSEPFQDKKHFKVVITRDNLKRAIEDTQMDLSKNLSDYELTFVGVLFELPNFVEGGHNTSMVEVSDFSVLIN
nr:hypothetical protein [uncultured Allomuricauda sp.]